MKKSKNREASSPTQGSDEGSLDLIQERDELENTYARIIREIEQIREQLQAKWQKEGLEVDTPALNPQPTLRKNYTPTPEVEVRPQLNADGLKIEQVQDGHQIKPKLSPIAITKNVAAAEGAPIAITPPQYKPTLHVESTWTNTNHFQDKKEASQDGGASNQEANRNRLSLKPTSISSPHPADTQKKLAEKKRQDDLSYENQTAKRKNMVTRKKSLADKTKKMKALKEGLETVYKKKKKKRKDLQMRWIAEAEEIKKQKRKKMQKQICHKKAEEKAVPPPPPPAPPRLF